MSHQPGPNGSRSHRTNRVLENPPRLVRQDASLTESRNGANGASPTMGRQPDESVNRTFYNSSSSRDSDTDPRAATPAPGGRANGAWDQRPSSDRSRSPPPWRSSRSGTAAGSSRLRDSERVGGVGTGLSLFPNTDNPAAAAAAAGAAAAAAAAQWRQRGEDEPENLGERQGRNTLEQMDAGTGYGTPIGPQLQPQQHFFSNYYNQDQTNEAFLSRGDFAEFLKFRRIF
jgi:hypothetical protein